MSKLLLLPLYLSVVVSAMLVIHATDESRRHYAAMIALDSPGEAASHAGKRFLESLTFGWYKGAEEIRQTRDALRRALLRSQSNVTHWSAALLGLIAGSIAWLAWTWRVWEKDSGNRAKLALHFCGCAAVCLWVGALAPILTIVASQEVTLLGRVVISHETKSFVGTVAALMARESWGVAFLLAFFSLVVPVSKLMLTAFALLCLVMNRLPRKAHTLLGGLHHLGRWSMTDVFVVAILVAFFGANKADATQAEVGPGLYFFAAHTLLSVTAGLLAPRGASDTGSGAK